MIDPDRRGRLEGSDDGYRLNLVEGDTLDVDEFHRLIASGDTSQAPLETAKRLGEALAICMDRSLGDLSYDDWAQPFVRGWTTARLAAQKPGSRHISRPAHPSR